MGSRLDKRKRLHKQIIIEIDNFEKDENCDKYLDMLTADDDSIKYCLAIIEEKYPLLAEVLSSGNFFKAERDEFYNYRVFNWCTCNSDGYIDSYIFNRMLCILYTKAKLNKEVTKFMHRYKDDIVTYKDYINE